MALQIYVLQKPPPFMLFFNKYTKINTKLIKGKETSIIHMDEDLRVEFSEGSIVILFNDKNKDTSSITHIHNIADQEKLLTLFALDVQYKDEERDHE
ncbi:MAG: hypothetical protein COA94_04855 [Rickettsiales bacterium]|nr:MAG: hypothetical protein COA94_04855 [Rickettsiales bacterium]